MLATASGSSPRSASPPSCGAGAWPSTRCCCPAPAVTLTNAGAPHTTLVAIIWLFVAAVLLVGPSFALLFALQGRRLLYADDAGIALAGVPGGATRPPAGPTKPAASLR